MAIAEDGAAGASPYQKELIVVVCAVCGVRLCGSALDSLFYARIELEVHEGYPVPGEDNWSLPASGLPRRTDVSAGVIISLHRPPGAKQGRVLGGRGSFRSCAA